MQIASDPTLLMLADLDDFLLEPFARGNVAQKPGKDPARTKIVFTYRQVEGELSSVLAPSSYFATNADDPSLPGVSIALEICTMLRTVRLRHKHGNVLTNNFARAIPKNLLGRRIHGFDDAMVSNGDNPVYRGLNDSLETRGRLPQVLFESCLVSPHLREVTSTFQDEQFSI